MNEIRTIEAREAHSDNLRCVIFSLSPVPDPDPGCGDLILFKKLSRKNPHFSFKNLVCMSFLNTLKDFCFRRITPTCQLSK